MNAGVNGAAIQFVGKAPVKGVRKKEEAGTAFPELLAGLAAMSQIFGGAQPEEVNQGKQAEEGLLNSLGQMTGKEEPGYLWSGGPTVLFPFKEGNGRRGVAEPVREIPFEERGAPIAGKHIAENPGQTIEGAVSTGGQKEHGALADTGAKPAFPALETSITSGQTAEPAVKGGPAVKSGPAGEAPLTAGSEILTEEASGGERETEKTDDGLAASSLREAYHLSGDEEPVKIKVAEPYYESKPQFARALSDTIATELSKGGSSLEIRLEPEELGSLLIKLQTGKDGTHIELHCASEKTALLLDKNLAEIGSFLRTHTETPVTLQIRQEIWPQPMWNQNQGNSGGRDSRDGKREKKRDDGIGDNEASDFIEKLRLGLEGL